MNEQVIEKCLDSGQGAWKLKGTLLIYHILFLFDSAGHRTSLPIREYDIPIPEKFSTCFKNETNYNPVSISFGNTAAHQIILWWGTVLVEKFKVLEFLLDKIIEGNWKVIEFIFGFLVDALYMC